MMKKAFTLLELIFVIVVMGIIGTVGANVIRTMYEAYFSSAVNSRMHADTELALQQITNRLNYRLRDSTILRRSGGAATDFVGLSSAPGDGTYDMMEWVGYDIDGWMGDWNGSMNIPTWSGFIDVNRLDTGEASTTALFSPSTDTGKANTIISALSSSGIDDAAIFFIGSDTDVDHDYGWDGTAQDQNNTAAYQIEDNAANLELLISKTGLTNDFSNIDIYEQYKLAWTAYALKIGDVNGNGRRDLALYQDYQPWQGEAYTTDTTPQILLENVSTIKVQAVGDVIKFQICVDNNVSGQTPSDELYSICKEKVIF